MVFVRHRHAASWGPFAHVASGDAVFNEFFGCAFWERADVLALLDRKEELRADGLDRVEADIGKDFRRDFRRLVVGRPDGKNDVVEAMARMRGVRL